jgi:glucosamine-6-phosphate deaminase
MKKKQICHNMNNKRTQSFDMIDSLEKIPCRIFKDVSSGSIHVAKEIAKQIRIKQEKNEQFVLGLATGSTPKTLYAELVRMHKVEGLSFKNVITFNLDEYFPIEMKAIQSYHYYMHRLLFNHIDMLPENINMFSGEIPKEEIKSYCLAYEKQIEGVGGIDLQILGIGVNGHIGFNEPGTAFFSKTRLVTLEYSTRIANAYEFPNISEVPRMAISMGLSTILKTKKIILMAWGPGKSKVIHDAVEGLVTEHLPASLLQEHMDCNFVLDESAAAELTRFKSPWLTGDCEWTPVMIRKALVNVALKTGKSILSLTANDYNENGLGDLLVEKGDVYEINLQVYYYLRDSITGWPGGKASKHNPSHPERMNPFPKKVIIFSPHPDDDIISMGGTFQRLHDQGHDVHVAYQTSGNIAVTDEFVTRFMDFAIGFEKIVGVDSMKTSAVVRDVNAYVASKKADQIDSTQIRAIKGLIRRSEAKATCRFVGLETEKVHFMNLPFYETGTIEKAPISENDIAITVNLLRKIQPHQIFCAGDLADPHGTHKVCLDVVLKALQQIKEEGDEWIHHCWMWLYKGAWQEWNIDEIEMAVPMSPDQLLRKRHGIFIHQSQKDIIPFQGDDNREFWQRAEERNKKTAALYASLGMPKYEAMEAFVRFEF